MKNKPQPKLAKIRVSTLSRTRILIEKARRGGSVVAAADRLIAAGYRAQMSSKLK